MLWMQTSSPDSRGREILERCRRVYNSMVLWWYFITSSAKKDELSHDLGAFYRIVILNGEVATSLLLRHDSGVEYNKRY